MLNGQIGEVEQKIAELDAIRDGLKRGLLGLREEQLELEDERECNASSERVVMIRTDIHRLSLTVAGIRERITIVDERTKGHTVATSSRRRRGPAFLPSEHDELPGGVAFMVSLFHKPRTLSFC